MLAGLGMRGDQLLPEELRLIERASGASPDRIAKDLEAQHEMLIAVVKDKDQAVLEHDLREKFAGKLSDEQLEAQLKIVSSPWFRSLLEYDPLPPLKKLSCPVLALNGEKDVQVTPERKLAAIREVLKAGGNQNFEVEELPGLNHLFQTAKTGAVSEYAEIEESLSPVRSQKSSRLDTGASLTRTIAYAPATAHYASIDREPRPQT